MGAAVDIKGQRFGRLLALESTGEKTRDKKIIWRFLCDCGSEARVSAKAVRSGMTQSCGCLQRDRTRAAHAKRRVTRSCATCGCEFAIKRSHAAKEGTYCSRPCMATGYATRLMGSDNPNFKDRPKDYKVIYERAWRARNRDRVRHWNRITRAKRLAMVGDHSERDIRRMLCRQGWRCACCESDLRTCGFHVDHIIPVARGGSNFVGNLQLLCPTCNLRKWALLPIEFRMRMRMEVLHGC